MLGIENVPDESFTIQELSHPEIPFLSAQKALSSEIQRLRGENITQVYHLHRTRMKTENLLHCGRATEQAQKFLLQNEIYALKQQLLVIETAKENSDSI